MKTLLASVAIFAQVTTASAMCLEPISPYAYEDVDDRRLRVEGSTIFVFDQMKCEIAETDETYPTQRVYYAYCMFEGEEASEPGYPATIELTNLREDVVSVNFVGGDTMPWRYCK